MTTTTHRARRQRGPGVGRRRWSLLDARLAPFVFLLPFMAIFLVFRLWPLIQAVEMSFQDVQGLQGNDWVGLENYQAHLRQPAVHDGHGEHVRLHDHDAHHPHPHPAGAVRPAGPGSDLQADGVADRAVPPGPGLARGRVLHLPDHPRGGRPAELGAHGARAAAAGLAHLGLTRHPVAAHHRDLALGGRQHALLQQRAREHLPGALRGGRHRWGQRRRRCSGTSPCR